MRQKGDAVQRAPNQSSKTLLTEGQTFSARYACPFFLIINFQLRLNSLLSVQFLINTNIGHSFTIDTFVKCYKLNRNIMNNLPMRFDIHNL